MSEMDDVERWKGQIEREVREHPVMVYAKGEKKMAVCGFSRRVMEILDTLEADYEVRNVLADPAIRPALVATTQWPTVPQVFIGGKFVGGCDILTEMYERGELQEALRATRPQGRIAGA